MLRGGRPTDLVWQHFHKIEINGKHYAKCKNCGNVRANRVDRMKTHIAQCLKGSPTVSCRADDDEIDADEPELEMPNKKAKPNPFFIRTSTDAAHKIDILVAKFFYANNIPFNVVEHPTFQSMVSALRPGYSPPTRKTLSNSLLNEVSTEIVEKTKEKLMGKKVTLVEDGWSNIHNDPVIATCIHSEGKTYFLDAIEAGATTKNAECHKNIIENAIQKAKDTYSCEVKAVVTDNAKVMAKTRELLEDNENDLLLYGCSAHWLNLVGQALTPEKIMKQVVKVEKYFRNHHLPSGLLKVEFPESLKPQLPGETRWNSQLACINTFLKNRPFYIQIAEKYDEKIDADICRLVNDYNLFKQCKDLFSMLQPVAIALDTAQKDTCSLADACSIWMSLMKENSLQPHVDIIQNRMKEILKPFHFLAYMLHPMFKGEGLSDAQSESARIWAEQKVPGCLSFLISFEGEAAPFPSSYFLPSVKNMDPITWWKAISKCQSFNFGPASDFVELAIQLLSSPASSAAIERMFSSFGLIHSKLRNRLGTEKCAKIVMCYRMLRGANELDY